MRSVHHSTRHSQHAQMESVEGRRYMTGLLPGRTAIMVEHIANVVERSEVISTQVSGDAGVLLSHPLPGTVVNTGSAAILGLPRDATPFTHSNEPIANPSGVSNGGESSITMAD